MWAVSELFLESLRKPHRMVSEITYTVPGGEPTRVRMKTGSVSCTANNIRRRSDLSLFASSGSFNEMMTEGTLFQISNGLRVGNTNELVPVFTGEISTGKQNGGEAGTVELALMDLGGWLARCDFVTAWVIPAGTTRVAAIAAIVTDARPGTSVVIEATDTGALAVAQTFTGSRWNAINKLTADGGTEAFFRADGAFLIRDQPSVSTAPAWTLNRLLKSVVRVRPQDRMYNTVVVSPSATDGSQTWGEQIVEITDTSHPRHKSKIGQVPYRLASPTIQTAESAQHAGTVRLDRVLGTTERLNMGAIANPALDGGDLLRIIVPQLAAQPADIYSHYVDDFTLDLNGGSMRLDTRRQALETV